MLLLLSLLALVNAVTLRSVANNACFLTGRESFRLFADLAPGELLRAVDSNLVTAIGTSIILNNLSPGGAAPVPPLFPSDTCSSYVSWNRISSGTDLTWITPDFRWTPTNVAHGWFLSDPLSSQAPASGTSVQIGQFTIQANATGPCDNGPSLLGQLNLITNGTRQNPQTVCLGSGCTPNTQCQFVTGYLVPSAQVPASGFGAPVMAYHLVTSNAAPIALNVSLITGSLPVIATNATVGLSLTVSNGLRTALQATYLSSGAESRLFFNASSLRRVLITVVRTGAANTCNTTSALGVLVTRQYSASQYIATLSNGLVSLQPTAQVATISVAGLANNFNFCGNIDYLVTQALGVSSSQYDHRIHLLASTSICGRIASSVGSPPNLGGWSVYANAVSCDSVDGVLHGLFRQFGLRSSDAVAPDNSVLSYGDGACMLGRVPTAEGVHRRSLNAVQLLTVGALSQSRVVKAVITPSVVQLYSPTYPFRSENVTQLIDMSLNFFASYRAVSDPTVDRQANFSQASSDGNPLGVSSYSGTVLIHRRMGDGSIRLLAALKDGQSYSSLGVINLQVFSHDRYSATVLMQFPSPPSVPLPAALPSSYSVYTDVLPGDTAMQSSAGGRNPLQSYSDATLLNLGVNGADSDPYVYIRLPLAIPRFSKISQAVLLLEASSHQAASDLYLEVAVESVDNSAPLTVGSNLYVRNWSTLRSRALVSSTLFYHDEISLDVTLLLQQIVERNLWNGNQFVTFRIRNDPLRPVQSSPGSRVVYSGLSCGANYGGGAYPCGPRLAGSYVARTTSNGNVFPTSMVPVLASPLSNLFVANDGLSHTLTETGAPVPHVVQTYTLSPLVGVGSATLFVRARVTGAETFQVQISRTGTSFSTVLTFSSADGAGFTTKSFNIATIATIAGPSLQVRIQDNQGSSATASSIEIDELDLFVTYYNVDCIVSAPGPFGRCPPACPGSVAQQCSTRTIVSPQQGTGAACPASLQVCQPCVQTPCPLLSGTLTINALVSVDSQQQWKTVQTNDVNSVDLYNIPGIPTAQIGVAGKALTTPGSTLPGGFWTSKGFNTVQGVTQCSVKQIVLTCPSGDAVANGAVQGALICQNGLIPGPTTPAKAVFTVECF